MFTLPVLILFSAHQLLILPETEYWVLYHWNFIITLYVSRTKDELPGSMIAPSTALRELGPKFTPLISKMQFFKIFWVSMRILFLCLSEYAKLKEALVYPRMICREENIFNYRTITQGKFSKFQDALESRIITRCSWNLTLTDDLSPSFTAMTHFLTLGGGFVLGVSSPWRKTPPHVKEMLVYETIHRDFVVLTTERIIYTFFLVHCSTLSI